MYSTHNERKFVAEIVNKYHSTYHSTIKMTSVHVKSRTYINYSKENNNKNLNLKLVI